MTYNGGQGPVQSRGPYQTINEANVDRILAGDDVKFIVEEAERRAQILYVTRSKLRKLYGEAIRIHLMLSDPLGNDQLRIRAWQRLEMFRPRLAYESGKDPWVKNTCDDLTQLVKSIDGNQQRFERFMNYFEALVAYSREK